MARGPSRKRRRSNRSSPMQGKFIKSIHTYFSTQRWISRIFTAKSVVPAALFQAVKGNPDSSPGRERQWVHSCPQLESPVPVISLESITISETSRITQGSSTSCQRFKNTKRGALSLRSLSKCSRHGLIIELNSADVSEISCLNPLVDFENTIIYSLVTPKS